LRSARTQCLSWGARRHQTKSRKLIGSRRSSTIQIVIRIAIVLRRKLPFAALPRRTWHFRALSHLQRAARAINGSASCSGSARSSCGKCAPAALHLLRPGVARCTWGAAYCDGPTARSGCAWRRPRPTEAARSQLKSRCDISAGAPCGAITRRGERSQIRLCLVSALCHLRRHWHCLSALALSGSDDGLCGPCSIVLGPKMRPMANGPMEHHHSWRGGECAEQQQQRDAGAGGGAVRARGDNKKIQRARERQKNVKNDDDTTTVNCDLE